MLRYIVYRRSNVVLLISTTNIPKNANLKVEPLRKNCFAATQRHLRLNALHTIKLQAKTKTCLPSDFSKTLSLKGVSLWRNSFT
jgi:hypothetical protein